MVVSNGKQTLLYTSFRCMRLNTTTFLIIEDDAFEEQPHIYVKIYKDLILINDTGCCTPRLPTTISSLRMYLEKVPIPCNGNTPLNPSVDHLTVAKPYMILCSHCHYDHILGIPDFIASNTSIVASSHDELFITKDLPTTSLCRFLDIPTPKYTVSHWAANLSYLSHPVTGTPLHVLVLHIPGHTPDSLAWYDIDEHRLSVGDMLYERKRHPDQFIDLPTHPELPENTGDIIFPEQGDWIACMGSLDFLLSFVQHQNRELKRQAGIAGYNPTRVILGAGHLTVSADAEVIITEVQALFWDILYSRLDVMESFEKRGVINNRWRSKDDKFGVTSPKGIVCAAADYFKKHPNPLTN